MKLERHEPLTWGDYLIVGAVAAPLALVAVVMWKIVEAFRWAS